MTIVLDHTIVPARDNEASARFFARIFGLDYEGTASHFAPVRVNESLVLDFDTRDVVRCPALRVQGERPGIRRDLPAGQG